MLFRAALPRECSREPAKGGMTRDIWEVLGFLMIGLLRNFFRSPLMIIFIYFTGYFYLQDNGTVLVNTPSGAL